VNTKGIGGHYDKLTPAERYQLILAADPRGDGVELARLTNSAGRIRAASRASAAE
jgi:hypothetical protein